MRKTSREGVPKNLTSQAKIIVASVKHCVMLCSLKESEGGF